MGICAICSTETTDLNEIDFWDDQEDERYMYSQVLDDHQSEMNFPGKWSALNICSPCLGQPQQIPDDTTVQTPPNWPRFLVGEMAVNLAKSLFEISGYKVKHSGYEFTHPEWLDDMKKGDASQAVLSKRATPDLEVYDPLMNSIYNVEVKTTIDTPSAWEYPKGSLDRLRLYHPTAILLVYVQGTHKVYAQKVQDIDWGNLPSGPKGPKCYVFDLETQFVSLPELFDKVSPTTYQEFLDKSRVVLKNLLPK